MKKRVMLVSLIVSALLLSSCGSSRNPSYEALESAIGQIDFLESSIHQDYGIYPEDAIQILNAYLYPEDYNPVSRSEVENALDAISAYYRDASAIARRMN